MNAKMTILQHELAGLKKANSRYDRASREILDLMKSLRLLPDDPRNPNSVTMEIMKGLATLGNYIRSQTAGFEKKVKEESSR